MTTITDDSCMPDNSDEIERNLHDDYRRKHIRIPPPKQMRDVLSQLLAKRGYAQIQTAASCEAAWREAVGEKLAGHTRPGNVRRGILEVLVRNSSVLQELSFLKAKAVKTLSRLVPEQQIKGVRFRVGAID
jgi:predicted nucleic acid-binding Zn ribbon protein